LGKINGKAIFGKFTKDYSKIQIKESSKPWVKACMKLQNLWANQWHKNTFSRSLTHSLKIKSMILNLELLSISLNFWLFSVSQNVKAWLEFFYNARKIRRNGGSENASASS
jgi:hypothetical protein